MIDVQNVYRLIFIPWPTSLPLSCYHVMLSCRKYFISRNSICLEKQKRTACWSMEICELRRKLTSEILALGGSYRYEPELWTGIVAKFPKLPPIILFRTGSAQSLGVKSFHQISEINKIVSKIFCSSQPQSSHAGGKGRIWG